jgi:predicted transcriptional regulator
MDLAILRRIEELKERLSDLRSRRCDTTSIIGIEAIEQELARTAARLPREWDVVWNSKLEDSITEGVQVDSRWSL